MLNANPRRHLMRPWLAVAVLILGCTMPMAWWLARGIEYALPAVQPAALQQLSCVSYSPFRYPDINPFNYLARVTPEQIEVDLSLLKTRTNCIRTYGLTQGLDAVPSVARKLGMRVKLGVWIARDATQNQAQLAQGLALARLYPDVVELLIVGNEVLLRRELTVQQLRALLKQAKAQSAVPITYADVWEFWQRADVLAQEVDLVTVHILPYWEDQPVAVQQAAKHVLDIGRKMQQHFAGKPVWIGETGWPAAGRQREGAVPGRVQQSAFLRDLLLLRPTIAQEFNLIEAFDQPWKRAFEGAMGGYWGMFDAQGRPRVSLVGPMAEDAFWWRGPLAGGLGAALGALLASWARRGSRAAVLIGGLGGGMLGAVCATQLLMVSWWDRSPFETAISIGLGAVGAAATALSLLQLMLDKKATASRLDVTAAALRLALLFCAASAALILLLDPRYRPFPWWWFLAPTVAWAALLSGAPHAAKQQSRQTLFLACVLALFALGLMLQEGWRNAQALSYGALLCCLAGVAAWPSLAKTKAANNAAGALGSVE